MKPVIVRVLSAMLLIGVATSSYAMTIVTDWTSQQSRSAIGELNGVTVTAATSADSEFLSIVGGRFTGDEWEALMPLTDEAESLVVGAANPGDTHTFVFTEPISDVMLYIENFDSNSAATVTAEGTGTLSLLSGSPSISFVPTLENSGLLSTTNALSDGEGDLILQLEGITESLSVDFASGDGANGVFYTLAVQVPEPVGASVMLVGLMLCGPFLRRWHRLRGA